MSSPRLVPLVMRAGGGTEAAEGEALDAAGGGERVGCGGIAEEGGGCVSFLIAQAGRIEVGAAETVFLDEGRRRTADEERGGCIRCSPPRSIFWRCL